MGDTQAFLQLLQRRSALTCAAYRLPHLRPGVHLSPMPEPSAGRPNAPTQKVLGQIAVQGDLAR